MFISQELRKKNIAEYLLYMWQVEDLIRAYQCSLSRIQNEYISKFDYSEEKKADLIDWYGDLIRMINQEGKREKGHLSINSILVEDLKDLHNQLLQSSKFPFYNAEYYKVLPFIVELRNKGDKDVNEIETCSLWCDDAQTARKATICKYRKCHQRDYYFYWYAF